MPSERNSSRAFRALRVVIALALLALPAAGLAQTTRRDYDDCDANFIAFIGSNAYQFSPLLPGELGTVRLFSILSYKGVTTDANFGRALWKLEIRGPEQDDTLVRAELGSTRIDERGLALVEYHWDGKDSEGQPVEPGKYHYTFKARFIGDRVAPHRRVEAYDDANGLDVADEAYASVRDVIVDYALDAEASLAIRLSLLATSCQTQQNAPMQAGFGYNFYYGSTHSHSNYSDGGIDPATCGSGKYGTTPGFTPPDVYSYVKANSGLDYWLINEHNHLINDALTGRGLAQTEANARQTYQDGLTAAAAATVSGSFVALYGMEWGVISGGGHVTVLDSPKLFGWETCTTCTGPAPECTPGTNCFFDVYTPKSNYPALYVASVANPSAVGPLGIFCHPNAGDFGNYAFNADADASIQGVAVRSGLAFATTGTCADANVGATDYSSQWRNALNVGFHVAPAADHDSHCNVYGVSNPIRTVYLIPNGSSPILTKTNLILAQKVRHFFASEDSNAQMVFETSDGSHVMGDIFNAGGSISLHGAVYDPNVEGVSTLELWRGQIGGGVLSAPYVTFAAGSTSFTQVETIASGTYYYFVHAVQADGHDIWSAPMWITFGASCTDSTTPVVSITAPTNGANVSGNVLVQVLATDAGPCGISTTQVRFNGGSWNNMTYNAGSGKYEYTWNSNATLCSGAVAIDARATDSSSPPHTGNATTVNVNVVNPDTTAPAVSIFSPANGATIVCSNTVVQVTATDAGGIASVQVSIDGGAWNAATFNAVSGKYEYTWSSATASSGPHTIDARATDTSCSANVGNATQISVTVDNSSCLLNPVSVFVARATNAQNLLQWVNPATGSFSGVMIRYRTDGVFPTSAADGTLVVDQAGALGAKASYAHGSLTNGTTYSYAAFAHDATPTYAASLTSPGRPQTVSGATKWVYNTGAAALTQAGGSIFFVSNDRVLHSASTGATGGDWPSSWKPFVMNGPSQARPRVVNVAIGGATRVAFVSSQDGHAYAVNADTGAVIWSSAQLGDSVQAGVSGTLTGLGYAFDVLLVGTRNSTAANSFVGLDPLGGTTNWTFNNGGGASGIGVINGAAAVNAAAGRVYFASRVLAGGSSGTLWCLSFTDAAASLCNASWPRALGDIDGSPILYGGRLYVGTNAGTVYALDPVTGATIWSAALGDGPIKGYVWPQYGANYFYVATTGKIWSLSDSGGPTPTTNWSFALAGASTPYYDSTSGKLFAGSSDGKLHQLSNLLTPTPTDVTETLGAGTSVVGSPAMDAAGLLDVGTESGAIYSVAVPLSGTPPTPGKVVISQVYGGGGNSGAPYTNDFVELFNSGGQAVTMTSWSIQYTSATGTSWGSQKTTFSGTLNPGQYYLIQLFSNGAVGSPLPTPDATGTTNMSATAGKVALVNNVTSLTAVTCPTDASIIDFIGYGTTANCNEGGTNAPAPSNTNADLRKLNGCQDTNVNGTDFVAGAPTPRNTASPLNVCP